MCDMICLNCRHYMPEGMTFGKCVVNTKKQKTQTIFLTFLQIIKIKDRLYRDANMSCNHWESNYAISD